MHVFLAIADGNFLKVCVSDVHTKRGAVLGQSRQTVNELQYLLNIPNPVTGDDNMEYIATFNDGSVHIYFRYKSESKALLSPIDQEENIFFLGEFIGGFNIRATIARKGARRRNKVGEITKLIEQTINRSWVEKLKRATEQLSIRIK